MLEEFAIYGRFHLVVLHLPIGLMFAVLGFELFPAGKNRYGKQNARTILLFIWLISALLAIGTGYLLGLDDDYNPDALTQHQNASYIVGILVLLTNIFNWFGRRAASGYTYIIYLMFMLFSSAMTILTGHYGGSLTHGDDFLKEVFIPREKSLGADYLVADTDDFDNDSDFDKIDDDLDLEMEMEMSMDSMAGKTPVAQTNTRDFAMFHQVNRILEDKCIECHGPKKHKSSYRMDSKSAAFEGGDDAFERLGE